MRPLRLAYWCARRASASTVNWQLSQHGLGCAEAARGGQSLSSGTGNGSPATQKTGVGTRGVWAGDENPPARRQRSNWRNTRATNCQYTHPTSHAITAAPTKRPLTFSVLQPAVVTVTDASAWTPVATLLYFRKGQTWFALICPQREQRYFLVSLPSFLVFRDGAGDIDVVSGSTKSGSAAFVGFRRRPVLRAALEGF